MAWVSAFNVSGPLLSRFRNALFFQGSLADRPDSASVPLNFTFLAVDNGIVYCNLADGWHQAGYDTILHSALSTGRAYVLELNAGATETYPGE